MTSEIVGLDYYIAAIHQHFPHLKCHTNQITFQAHFVAKFYSYFLVPQLCVAPKTVQEFFELHMQCKCNSSSKPLCIRYHVNRKWYGISEAFQYYPLTLPCSKLYTELYIHIIYYSYILIYLVDRLAVICEFLSWLHNVQCIKHESICSRLTELHLFSNWVHY